MFSSVNMFVCAPVTGLKKKYIKLSIFFAIDYLNKQKNKGFDIYFLK